MVCYRYRLPGSREIVGGEDFGAGFLVQPFSTVVRGISFPERSTTPEEHRESVLHILGEIESGKLDKCVLATTLVKRGLVDVDLTFRALCDAYPSAFVFLFSSPVYGTWMGASPELLLKRRGNRLETMALAGTRAAGVSDCEWDNKNVREQGLVTEFIVDTMTRFGLEPEVGQTVTLCAGPVEHLMTPIEANGDGFGTEDALDLAKRLSPTPALSGLPRAEALKLMEETERFDRGCYGGFCGPIYANGDFDLFVNLRSMQIEPERFALYAGGGIVSGSEPEAEWKETRKKMSTLSQLIVCKQHNYNNIN